MAIALWIVQGLLGLLFVITGSFKFFQSKEKVIESGGTWAEDFVAVAAQLTGAVVASLLLRATFGGLDHLGATLPGRGSRRRRRSCSKRC